MFLVDTHLTYASVGWGEWNDSWTFTSKKWEHRWNSWTWWPSTNYLSQPTTWHLVSSDVKPPVTSTWPRWRERLGLGWWGIYGTTKSMGTTKFVIYYLCYTYNVVFCFDWVKGCRGDIPLENLDFGIIAPPVGTPWYIYIYVCVYT